MGRRTRRALTTLALAALLPGAVPPALAGASTAPAPAVVVGRAVAAGSTTSTTASSTVTLEVSSTTVQPGERLWVQVRAARGKHPVVLRARALAASSGDAQDAAREWEVVARGKTAKNGVARLHLVVRRSVELRAAVLQGPGKTRSRSARTAVRVSRGDVLLADRAVQLGTRLGAPRSSVERLGRAALRSVRRHSSGVTSVRWRTYARGTLVEVTRHGRVRTWLVDGTLGTSYRKAHGPRGRWGAPTADARCGLLQKGCTQHFTTVTAYASPRKGSATTADVRGRRGEVEAALRSWVGYRVRLGRPNLHTPFQKWMGSREAWCGYFQTWAFYASGNADLLLPKRRLIPFANMRKNVHRTLRIGTEPKPGALAFIGFRNTGTATHVAYVVRVEGSKVLLLHGNTTGSGMVRPGYRGVIEAWLPTSFMRFYAYPDYGKDR